MQLLCFFLITSHCLVLGHGPGLGPGPGPGPKLVPVLGPIPGPAIYLFPVLVPVPVTIYAVTQWSYVIASCSGLVLSSAVNHFM